MTSTSLVTTKMNMSFPQYFVAYCLEVMIFLDLDCFEALQYTIYTFIMKIILSHSSRIMGFHQTLLFFCGLATPPTPPQKNTTLSFLPYPLLNLQIVRAPAFRRSPLYNAFLAIPPPRNLIFQWTPTILKFFILKPHPIF